MNGTAKDRIRGLLAEGWDLLKAGRSREAADAFGRVLLLHPEHAEARRGLDAARTGAAEQARLLDERMDEAARAIESGDRQRARALLEEVVSRGGDRDRALHLLDRLEERGGRLESAAAPAARRAAGAAPEVSSPRGGWSRRAFAVGWAFVFAALAAGLAVSWEQLVQRLVRRPSPDSRVVEPVRELAASAPGSGGPGR